MASSKSWEASLIYVVAAIRYATTPIDDASKILQQVIVSSKVNTFELNEVRDAINKTKSPIENKAELLKLIEKRIAELSENKK